MTEPSQSTPSSAATLLGALALLVAGGHLAYAMVNAPGSAPTAEVEALDAGAKASASDDGDRYREEMNSLRKEVQELRREVEQLRATKTVRTADRAGSAATPVGAPSAAAQLERAESAGPGFPKIEAFSSMPAGVRLEQRADGSLSAVATDPAQSGKEFVISVVLAEGETKNVRVRAE